MEFDALTPMERLIAEQAVLLARTVKAAGNAAPYGHILNHLEKSVMSNRREFVRQTLERIAQDKINEIETADLAVGLEEGYTAGAKQVITLASGSWGFLQSAAMLKRFLGIFSKRSLRSVGTQHGIKERDMKRSEISHGFVPNVKRQRWSYCTKTDVPT